MPAGTGENAALRENPPHSLIFIARRGLPVARTVIKLHLATRLILTSLRLFIGCFGRWNVGALLDLILVLIYKVGREEIVTLREHPHIADVTIAEFCDTLQRIVPIEADKPAESERRLVLELSACLRLRSELIHNARLLTS